VLPEADELPSSAAIFSKFHNELFAFRSIRIAELILAGNGESAFL
jgi:hypothetical protein